MYNDGNALRFVVYVVGPNKIKLLSQDTKEYCGYNDDKTSYFDKFRCSGDRVIQTYDITYIRENVFRLESTYGKY